MKKIIPILLISLMLLSPIFADSADATTVFLTSDNLHGHDADLSRLNAIKEKIESKTNGEITVIVDDSASNPGEGTRVMGANCDIGVAIAGACAGNLVDLADYASKVSKKIIFVNAGSLDLYNINFLRRSYDDNWSHYTFAAVQNPGKFLNDAGITLLQPAIEYPDECRKGIIKSDSDAVNEYIADEIIKAVNAGTNENKQLDSNLIVYHKLDPKYLAEDSKKIVDGHGGDMQESYGSYTTQQLLYMSSSYIAGYALEAPPEFQAPDNPQKYSSFTRWSYSFNDYNKMADLVVDYMNKNGKAPDSIQYEGATIGYYDLVYNFALLCEDDTSASNMNFPSDSGFQKYYSNVLFDILHIGIMLVGIVILILVIRTIIRRIKRKIQMSKQKRYNRRRGSRSPRQFQRNLDSQYYSDYNYDYNYGSDYGNNYRSDYSYENRYDYRNDYESDYGHDNRYDHGYDYEYDQRYSNRQNHRQYPPSRPKRLNKQRRRR